MTDAIAVVAFRPQNLAELARTNPLGYAREAFLARYRGRTLEAYTLDLDIYLDWCTRVGLPPLQATRPTLELYIRWMEQVASVQTGRPWSSATISRRFGTVRTFYKYCAIDDLILKDPAVAVTPPRVRKKEQKRTFLSALEYGRLLAAATEAGPREHALISLLGTNALRISEACQLNIEDITVDRGYDTIHFVGKGGEPDSAPLSVPVMRAVRAAIGTRTAGPILVNRDGRRMDRASATRMIRRVAAAAKVNTDISPHSLRRTSATTLLAIGTPLREVQLLLRHASPNTTVIYDRGEGNADRHASHRLASYISGIAG
jgi:integrase/recombinase XerD